MKIDKNLLSISSLEDFRNTIKWLTIYGDENVFDEQPFFANDNELFDAFDIPTTVILPYYDNEDSEKYEEELNNVLSYIYNKICSEFEETEFLLSYSFNPKSVTIYPTIKKISQKDL